MSTASSSNRPTLLAIIGILITGAVLVGLFIFVELLHIATHTITFWLGVLFCLLVGYILYLHADQASAREHLAQEMTADMLKSSKELFSEVYHNSPVPYILLSAEGKVLSVNTAAVRLFRLERESIQGEDIFTYLLCQKPDHLALMQNKYARGVSITSEEVQVLQKDGGIAWAQLSLFRFADAKNQHLGLLTLVDTTKQKEIDTAKSEFVSLASHQLRTPIAGMRWSAELLLLDTSVGLSDQQQKYVTRLLQSIARMSSLVDDFLSVSRLELGALKAEEMLVPLVPLIEGILHEQQAVVGQKQLEITTHFDPNVTELVTDPKLLGMVITNLYANAVKYTRPSGRIVVGFERQANTLFLTVADTGIGIPEEEQKRIFTKIFRASNALKEVSEGTGLGLYIAREATRVLRGNITFSSTENTGTTFTVTLPIG